MHYTALLENHTDWQGFRRQARRALIRGIAPDAIVWQVRTQAMHDMFAADILLPDDEYHAGGVLPDWKISRRLLQMCESAILHRDNSRFALVYQFLWRLRQEPALAHDPLDADRLRLQDMVRAVNRDMHKMTAFVRFRPAPGSMPDKPCFIAWFEPEHYIVQRIAPFFTRRFTSMHWAILTPDCCIRWINGRLEEGPGMCRGDVPGLDSPGAERGEALWLTYYRHIFNPARLKVDMMRKEMPCKYWRNLPEASLIPELTATAMQRSANMLERDPSAPSRYAEKARRKTD